jgi:glycine/D-amino acid oxidase-like deaminating enzyme
MAYVESLLESHCCFLTHSQGHVKVKTDSLLQGMQSHGPDFANEYAAFVSAQIYALKKVVETEGLDCEFELRRSFDAWLDEAEAKTTKADFLSNLREGNAWTTPRDLVDGKFVEQITSLKGVKTAVSSPIASLWPYKLVTQLLAKLIENDVVNLQTNTPVTSVSQYHSSGLNIIQTRSRGTLKARKVIYATNGYTAGICSLYSEQIVPTKGTACHITPLNGPVAPHLSHTYNINYSPGRVDYLNPRPDSGIVVGGGNWTYNYDKSVWSGNWDDSTLFPQAKDHFNGLMQRHFHGWEKSGAEADQIWTGIMGYTGDGQPHIGEIPGREGSQYVIAGFNGGGNAMIFLCAKGLAKMVLKGIPFEKSGLPMFFKTTTERLRTPAGAK